MGYFHCLGVVNSAAVNMDMRICLQDYASFEYIPKSKAQSVKNLPALQETQVQSLGWEDPLEKEMAKETQIQSLGWEDPLEKEMANHSSVLAWKNPMGKGAWCAVHGVAKSQA